MIRSALAGALVCFGSLAGATDITSAEFTDPTTRYRHGVLGDAIEWGTLEMRAGDGRLFRVVLPDRRVFEDVAPRLADVDGDGEFEVVVVESDMAKGARLSVYDTGGLVTATEFIGTPNRWLAPVGIGAADLDGDGVVEFAYVDRPHLAKTLRIFRFAEVALSPIAELPGVTNHRIGERDIAGGIRNCGTGPELLVASSDWSRLLAIRFDGEGFRTDDLGSDTSRPAFAKAMSCL